MSIRDVLLMALAGFLVILAIAAHARTSYRYEWSKVGLIVVGGLAVEMVWCAVLFAVYTVLLFTQIA